MKCLFYVRHFGSQTLEKIDPSAHMRSMQTFLNVFFFVGCVF